MDQTKLLATSQQGALDEEQQNALPSVSLSTALKVLLVDPETLLRNSLKHLIESSERYDVTECSCADAALELIDKIHPDILISEIALPDISGIELLRETQRRQCPLKTLFLSAQQNPQTIEALRAIGAQGFLPKSCESCELFEALEELSNGRDYFAYASQTAMQTGHLTARVTCDNLESEDPICTLSQREREIFHLLANGLQNSTIAKKLFISPRTVETHRARIVRKLGIQSNAELIRFAIKNGLSAV